MSTPVEDVTEAESSSPRGPSSATPEPRAPVSGGATPQATTPEPSGAREAGAAAPTSAPTVGGAREPAAVPHPSAPPSGSVCETPPAPGGAGRAETITAGERWIRSSASASSGPVHRAALAEHDDGKNPEFPALPPFPVPVLGGFHRLWVEPPPPAALESDRRIQLETGISADEHHDRMRAAAERLVRAADAAQHDVVERVAGLAKATRLSIEELAGEIPGAVEVAIGALRRVGRTTHAAIAAAGAAQQTRLKQATAGSREKANATRQQAMGELETELFKGSEAIERVHRELMAEFDSRLVTAGQWLREVPRTGTLHQFEVETAPSSKEDAREEAEHAEPSEASKAPSAKTLPELLTHLQAEFSGQNPSARRWFGDTRIHEALPSAIDPVQRQMEESAAQSAKDLSSPATRARFALVSFGLVAPMARSMSGNTAARRTDREIRQYEDAADHAKRVAMLDLDEKIRGAQGWLDKDYLPRVERGLRKAGRQAMRALRGYAKVAEFQVASSAPAMAQAYRDLAARLPEVLPPKTFLDNRTYGPRVQSLEDAVAEVHRRHLDTAKGQQNAALEGARKAKHAQLEGIGKSERDSEETVRDTVLQCQFDFEMAVAEFTGNYSHLSAATRAGAREYLAHAARRIQRETRETRGNVTPPLRARALNFLNSVISSEQANYYRAIRETEGGLRQARFGGRSRIEAWRAVAMGQVKEKTDLVEAGLPRRVGSLFEQLVAAQIVGLILPPVGAGMSLMAWIDLYCTRARPDLVLQGLGALTWPGPIAVAEQYEAVRRSDLESEIRERLWSSDAALALGLLSHSVSERVGAQSSIIEASASWNPFAITAETRNVVLRGMAPEEVAALTEQQRRTALDSLRNTPGINPLEVTAAQHYLEGNRSAAAAARLESELLRAERGADTDMVDVTLRLEAVAREELSAYSVVDDPAVVERMRLGVMRESAALRNPGLLPPARATAVPTVPLATPPGATAVPTVPLAAPPGTTSSAGAPSTAAEVRRRAEARAQALERALPSSKARELFQQRVSTRTVEEILPDFSAMSAEDLGRWTSPALFWSFALPGILAQELTRWSLRGVPVSQDPRNRAARALEFLRGPTHQVAVGAEAQAYMALMLEDPEAPTSAGGMTHADRLWAARATFETTRAEGGEHDWLWERLGYSEEERRSIGAGANRLGLSSDTQVRLTSALEDPEYDAARVRLEELPPDASPDRRAAAEAEVTRLQVIHERRMQAFAQAMHAPAASTRNGGAATDWAAERIGRLFSNQGWSARASNTLFGRHGPSAADYGREMIRHGRASVLATALLARQGVGTNEALLTHALTGRSRTQLAKACAEYRSLGGGNLLWELGVEGERPDPSNLVQRKEWGPLFAGQETSGDVAAQLTRLARGNPTCDADEIELAILESEQQLEGGTGSLGEVTMGGTNQLQGLRARRQELGAVLLESAGLTGRDPETVFDDRGRIRPEIRRVALDSRGNLRNHAARPRLREAIGEVQYASRRYRAELDRQESILTTAITVLTTIVSAVALLIPGVNIVAGVIAAAAGGALLMGAKASMRGARYGWEEAATDAATTVLEAATAGAGGLMGLGAAGKAAAGAARGTATTAVRGTARAAEALSARVAQSAPGRWLGGVGRVLEERLGTVGGAAAREGITSAVNSVGSAALQEDTWRGGALTGLGRVIGSGIRGAIGGAVSGGVSTLTQGSLGRWLRPQAVRRSGLPTSGARLGRVLGTTGRELVKEVVSNTLGAVTSETANVFTEYLSGNYRGSLAEALRRIGESGVRELSSASLRTGVQTLNKARFRQLLDHARRNPPLSQQDLRLLRAVGISAGEVREDQDFDHVRGEVEGGRRALAALPPLLRPLAATLPRSELERLDSMVRSPRGPSAEEREGVLDQLSERGLELDREGFGELFDSARAQHQELELRARLPERLRGLVVGLDAEGLGELREYLEAPSGAPLDEHLVARLERTSPEAAPALVRAALEEGRTQFHAEAAERAARLARVEGILAEPLERAEREALDREELASLERLSNAELGVAARLVHQGLDPEALEGLIATVTARDPEVNPWTIRRGLENAARAVQACRTLASEVERKERREVLAALAPEARPAFALLPPEAIAGIRRLLATGDQGTPEGREALFRAAQASQPGLERGVFHRQLDDAIASAAAERNAKRRIRRSARAAGLREYPPEVRGPLSALPDYALLMVRGLAAERLPLDPALCDELVARARTETPGVDEGRLRTALARAVEAPPRQAQGEEARALRQHLLASVPSAVRERATRVPLLVVSPEEFRSYTRSESGEAVTLIIHGRPLVVVPEGVRPTALREEGAHVAQAFDPRWKEHLGALDESRQAHWDELSVEEQLTLYDQKVELEIDAQRTLLRDLEAEYSSADPRARAGLEAELELAQSSLHHLTRRRAEIEHLTPIERRAMATGTTSRPEWLEQPARLFAKKKPSSEMSQARQHAPIEKTKVPRHIESDLGFVASLPKPLGDIEEGNGLVVALYLVQPERRAEAIWRIRQYLHAKDKPTKSDTRTLLDLLESKTDKAPTRAAIGTALRTIRNDLKNAGTAAKSLDISGAHNALAQIEALQQIERDVQKTAALKTYLKRIAETLTTNEPDRRKNILKDLASLVWSQSGRLGTPRAKFTNALVAILGVADPDASQFQKLVRDTEFDKATKQLTLPVVFPSRRESVKECVRSLRAQIKDPKSYRLEGYILDTVLVDFRRSVELLAQKLKEGTDEGPFEAMLSVERGGGFLSELLAFKDAELSRIRYNFPKGIGNKRTSNLLTAIALAGIGRPVRRIVVVDFAMGGGFASEIREQVVGAIERYAMVANLPALASGRPPVVTPPSVRSAWLLEEGGFEKGTDLFGKMPFPRQVVSAEKGAIFVSTLLAIGDDMATFLDPTLPQLPLRVFNKEGDVTHTIQPYSIMEYGRVLTQREVLIRLILEKIRLLTNGKIELPIGAEFLPTPKAAV